MFDWRKATHQYWPAVLLAMFFALAVYFEWSSASAPHQINQTAADQNAHHRSVDNNSSLFFAIGAWAGSNHDAIEAVAALISLFFTFVLVGANIALWLATLKLYGSGEHQIRSSRKIAAIQAQQARLQFKFAKETADKQAAEIQAQIKVAQDNASATQKAADAAVATERARLFVEIKQNFEDCIDAVINWEGSGVSPETRIAASNYPLALIKFKNYGRTPAVLDAVSLGIEFVDGVGMPSFVFTEQVVRENILATEQTSQEFSIFIDNMTFGMCAKVRDGGGTIWIYGEAIYDDVFGGRPKHRFLRRYVPIIPRVRYVLQSYDYQHYNRST